MKTTNTQERHLTLAGIWTRELMWGSGLTRASELKKRGSWSVPTILTGSGGWACTARERDRVSDTNSAQGSGRKGSADRGQVCRDEEDKVRETDLANSTAHSFTAALCTLQVKVIATPFERRLLKVTPFLRQLQLEPNGKKVLEKNKRFCLSFTLNLWSWRNINLI